MKYSSETLQNFLPMFYLNENHMNALVHVDIDQGIHEVKCNVAWNEKWKKLHGFSYTWNIEIFWSISLQHLIKHKLLISEEFDMIGREYDMAY